MGHFGFSYIGALYLLMLFIPNLIWTRNQPEGYDFGNENKLLLWCERIGQVGVSCCALIFTDFNLRPLTPWSLRLALSFALMLLYEGYWVRYFRSGRKLKDCGSWMQLGAVRGLKTVSLMHKRQLSEVVCEIDPIVVLILGQLFCTIH